MAEAKKVGRGPVRALWLVGVLGLVTVLLGSLSPNDALGAGPSHRLPPPPSVDRPHYCDGCTPPLVYQGGPVMDTNSAAGVTITPVYWAPAGSPYSFPERYEQILNGFIDNIATASGDEDTFNSVDTEYYDVVDAATIYISYHFTAGAPIVDTAPFPANGCKLARGATACLTDQQLREELLRLTTAEGLPVDLGHLYPLFLPNGVEVQDRDGTNSVSDFCGYHRGFAVGQAEAVYAVLPYETSGCDAGEAPNGDLVADAAVSTLAHEISEAVTDPDDQSTAWTDSNGNEIADICADSYGPPLGSTSSAHPYTTEYNQEINGGKYYIQELFSNLAFAADGPGHGCVQSEVMAQHPTSSSGTVVASIFADATPTRLPADGRATTSLDVSVGDNQGNVVTGDRVTFQVRSRSGARRCGQLNRTSGRTGSGGDITVVYTASRSNAECEITALEAEGGFSANSVIYQGTTERQSPRLDAHFPASIRAGGAPTTFTIAVSNPSTKVVPAAQVVIDLFQGGPASRLVRSSQVQLSYSTGGPGGLFAPVALNGTTAANDSIEGDVGPAEGSPLAPGSTQTYTFRLSVASGVPSERRGQPLLSIEAYLDQVDSATGSGTTLDDSYASDLHVTRP